MDAYISKRYKNWNFNLEFKLKYYIVPGPSGVLIQQHHYQAVPAQTSEPTSEPTNGLNPSPAIEPLVPTNQLARSISQVALQECK